jgi:hypothetical protein
MEEDLDVLRHALPCDRSLELEDIAVNHDYRLIRFNRCWWGWHSGSVKFLLLFSSRLCSFSLFFLVFSGRFLRSENELLFLWLRLRDFDLDFLAADVFRVTLVSLDTISASIRHDTSHSKGALVALVFDPGNIN